MHQRLPKKMKLVDTHCHIHESSYTLPIDEVIERSREAGVDTMLVVGTDEKSSDEAVVFASQHQGAFAAVGVHPHEAKHGWNRVEELVKKQDSTHKIVAVGEIGLDYFYTHSSREEQIEAFESQLQLAQDYNLPVSFHVREAFDDFWPIFDNFKSIRGVLHSFTDSIENAEKGFARGLYVGLNGISVFTRDPAQQQMYKSFPLGRILLETDAPFLTPPPFRGRINEPALVRSVAEYHASVRNITLEDMAEATTANANALFAF
jgi:TatD DNase family protein